MDRTCVGCLLIWIWCTHLNIGCNHRAEYVVETWPWFVGWYSIANPCSPLGVLTLKYSDQCIRPSFLHSSVSSALQKSWDCGEDSSRPCCMVIVWRMEQVFRARLLGSFAHSTCYRFKQDCHKLCSDELGYYRLDHWRLWLSVQSVGIVKSVADYPKRNLWWHCDVQH